MEIVTSFVEMQQKAVHLALGDILGPCGPKEASGSSLVLQEHAE